MIDHSQLDGIHDGLKRMMGVGYFIIDDILTHVTNDPEPKPCGYLVTYHSANSGEAPRAAYFTAKGLREGKLPVWAMVMSGEV